MSDPPSSALLDLARRVAADAGAQLLARAGGATGVEAKTSATDPVSDADRASESLLTGAILAARPDDAMVGEEGTDRGGTSGLRWVLDPLDGTVNYLYGFPAWCVSVACEDEQGAVVGVVHDPLRAETFVAERARGAWLWSGGASTALRLRVNDPVPLDRALVATGFSYDRQDRRRQAATVAALLPQVRDIRRAGSCALDLCAVAAGRVDGYYEDTTSRWDWAAGALIAAEAGAVVTLLPGGHGRSGVLTAGRALHAALRDALTAAGTSSPAS